MILRLTWKRNFQADKAERNARFIRVKDLEPEWHGGGSKRGRPQSFFTVNFL